MNTPGNHPPLPPSVQQTQNVAKTDVHTATAHKPYLRGLAESADKQIAIANIDNPHNEVKIE